jgi:serine/threonine protein kinase
LKRAVAVKVLREDVATQDVARLRFEREAQAVAAISHPNITSVFRVGRLDDGVPYFVMEYIEGRRLGALIESRGAFEVEEARRVLASVAAALKAAHKKGVVHRDLRPDNVMLETESDRVVLMDFGLAALAAPEVTSTVRLTKPGERLGDPSHMSPEQLRGGPVTQASDIYAFGVLAYEVLTGAGPFRARSDAEVGAAHLSAEPPPLQELRSDVEPGLAALVRRCLAKSPEHRPLAGWCALPEASRILRAGTASCRPKVFCTRSRYSTSSGARHELGLRHHERGVEADGGRPTRSASRLVADDVAADRSDLEPRPGSMAVEGPGQLGRCPVAPTPPRSY